MPEPLTTRILKQLISEQQSARGLATSLREDVLKVQRCVSTMRREKRIRQAREDRKLVWATRGGKRGPSRVAVWDVTDKGRAEVSES